jgi:hypothetical protein
MANPTSNFGWQMPTNTDLVKDLPADFEVFGQAVDSDLADLKGGTTGQVLSKTSGTDLDFTWITPNVGDITEVQAGTGISVASGTGPIPIITNTVATEFDVKGDLIVGTGSDTFDRLAVGTDTYNLVADSSSATGLAWAAPAGGNKTYTLLNTGGTSLSGSAAVTVNVATKEDYVVLVQNATCGTRVALYFRINGDSGANYITNLTTIDADPTYAAASFKSVASTSQTHFVGATRSDNGSSAINFAAFVSAGNSTTLHPVHTSSSAVPSGGDEHTQAWVYGLYSGSAAITSFTITNGGAANWTGGVVYIYGA